MPGSDDAEAAQMRELRRGDAARVFADVRALRVEAELGPVEQRGSSRLASRSGSRRVAIVGVELSAAELPPQAAISDARCECQREAWANGAHSSMF